MLSFSLIHAGGSGRAGEIARYLSGDQVPEMAARYYGRDAELRPDLSLELAKRLGIGDPRIPLTTMEIARLLDGKRADDGLPVKGRTARTANADGKRRRVQAFDFTMSAAKSVSAAWALAGSEIERYAIIDAHKKAVRDAMRYMELEFCRVRRGRGGKYTEAGEWAYIAFHHYTSRPTRPDALPHPQIHSHVVVLNSVLTDSGHIGSLDGNRLKGRILEFGGVYQLNVAHYLRHNGIDAVLENGTARIPAVPVQVIELFSRRSVDARALARERAEGLGLDFDGLSRSGRSAFVRRAVLSSRFGKEVGRAVTEDSWRQEGEGHGYKMPPLLTPDRAAELMDRRQVETQARSVREEYLAWRRSGPEMEYNAPSLSWRM